MSFYRNYVESTTGLTAIKHKHKEPSGLDSLYGMSNTDHRSLGQVVTLPENTYNCPTDYLSSDELHQRAQDARAEMKKLAEK